MTPKSSMNRTLHPEVDHLLHSNPNMTCLQAGSSNLAQATFQMMRNTNVMRFGTNQAGLKADDHYSKLKEEMIERRKEHQRQLNEYKQSVVQAKEDKKRIQAENGAFWLQQADWKRQKKLELKNEPYDPDQVWNIEEPDRKQREAIERKAVNANLKEVNAKEQKGFYQRKQDARNLDKMEGQKMIELDTDCTVRERQLREFKRQMFAQEMLDSCNKQKSFRKNMKEIENEK